MQLQTQKMVHVWISQQLGFRAVASRKELISFDVKVFNPMPPVIRIHRHLHSVYRRFEVNHCVLDLTEGQVCDCVCRAFLWADGYPGKNI